MLNIEHLVAQHSDHVTFAIHAPNTQLSHDSFADWLAFTYFLHENNSPYTYHSWGLVHTETHSGREGVTFELLFFVLFTDNPSSTIQEVYSNLSQVVNHYC